MSLDMGIVVDIGALDCIVCKACNAQVDLQVPSLLSNARHSIKPFHTSMLLVKNMGNDSIVLGFCEG